MKYLKISAGLIYISAIIFSGCSMNPVLSQKTWEDSDFVLSGDYIDIADFPSIVADDGVSDSEGFQEALAEAAESGKPLYLPAGDYEIDSAIIPLDGVVISGDRDGGTVISSDNEFQTPLMEYPDASGLVFEDIVFDNVFFNFSTGDSENSGYKTVEGVTFRRCLFISDMPSFDSFVINFQYGATGLLFEDSVMLFDPAADSKGNKGFNLNGSKEVTIKDSLFGLDLTDDADLEYAELNGTAGLNSVLQRVRSLRSSGRLSGAMNRISELIRLWNKEGEISDMKRFTGNISFGESGSSGSWAYLRYQLQLEVSGNYVDGFNTFTQVVSGPYPDHIITGNIVP